MSDDARPDAASTKLELEPLVLPPALAAQTVVDLPREAAIPRAVHATTAVAKRAAAAVRRRIGTSVATSVVIHLAFFLLLFILWPGHDTPPVDEPPIIVSLKDWHWVGDDPEGEGSGPKGPVPETPVTEPAKGKQTAAGFLDQDVATHGSLGLGGGAVGSMFAGRLDGKAGLVAAGGGDGETEGAVRLALAWLARHQEKDGTWNSRTFLKRCQGAGCAEAVDEEYVTATTAMALLPFLGAGHTWREGEWKDVVRRGLAALHARQRPDGRFEDGAKHVYGDAFATLAVSEAFGLTQNDELRDMAGRAVAYFVRGQSESGGWRYEPGDGDADASVTGWVAMALASAKKAGIDVPDATLARCRAWLREHTDRDGQLGYRSAGTGSRAMLGVGIFVPVMLGASVDEPDLAAAGRLLDAAPPRWPTSRDDPAGDFGAADPLHWYYGSLAEFQRGGDAWARWHEKLKPLLLSHQEKRACAAGSWPAVGQTGVKGGRVIVTALCALTLEVYYRYPRVTAVR